jgi:hypothetical protein
MNRPMGADSRTGKAPGYKTDLPENAGSFLNDHFPRPGLYLDLSLMQKNQVLERLIHLDQVRIRDDFGAS